MHYTPAEKKEWARMASHLGMDLSVGKCYTAQDWLQINSAGFMFESGQGFVHAPYINFGLLRKERIKGGEKRHWSELSAIAYEFLRGHPKEKHHDLMALFIKWHLKEDGLLRDCPPGISWWLPVHLGGLGLPWTGTPEDLERQVSFRQRQMGSMVLKSLVPGKTPIRPTPGADLGLPGFLQKGLVRDKRFEIPFPVEMTPEEEAQLQWFDERRAVMSQTSYLSSLWESVYDLPKDDEEWKVLSKGIPCSSEAEWNKRKSKMNTCWLKVWGKSKGWEEVLDTQTLLTHRRVRYALPGGLSKVLERTRAIPKGILGRISAIVELREGLGVSESDMKVAGWPTYVGDRRSEKAF
jgi:hypothetical protein